jgi:hypothetical protein
MVSLKKPINYLNRVICQPDVKKRLQRNPELALIGQEPAGIQARHEAEFKTFTIQGLTSQQLRAIYHNLPAFRRDQKVQIEVWDP